MAKKQSGLGRDLYSLFDDNLIEEKKEAGTTLRISDIEPRKDQPRKIFEREALEALADSISTYGVLGTPLCGVRALSCIFCDGLCLQEAILRHHQ